MLKKVRFQVCSHDDRNLDMMPKTQPNYFACTLGEAAQWNTEHPHSFHTVNDLIDGQAEQLRHRPAVNFPDGWNGEDGRGIKSGKAKQEPLYTYKRNKRSSNFFPSDFTYRELRDYSVVAAIKLRRRMQIASRGGSTTVGLLCSSSPEFILAWLGLMRLGMAVMLLSYVIYPFFWP